MPSPGPPEVPAAFDPAGGRNSWTEGAFTFTWKAPSRSLYFGALQVTCPFHACRSRRKDGLRTRCTKTLHMKNATPAELDSVVTMCRWWALQSEVSDRKRTHGVADPRQAENALPGHADILREQCLATSAPVSEPMLDEDLDADAERARAAAASGAQPDDSGAEPDDGPADDGSSSSGSSSSSSSSSGSCSSSSSSSEGG